MSCKFKQRADADLNLTTFEAPCRYLEYRLVGEPEESRHPDGKRTFELALSDTMINSVTEEKLYGFISFLAEFGGALGLFVGWSLLSVFDLVEVVRRFLPDLQK